MPHVQTTDNSSHGIRLFSGHGALDPTNLHSHDARQWQTLCHTTTQAGTNAREARPLVSTLVKQGLRHAPGSQREVTADACNRECLPQCVLPSGQPRLHRRRPVAGCTQRHRSVFPWSSVWLTLGRFARQSRAAQNFASHSYICVYWVALPHQRPPTVPAQSIERKKYIR